MSSKLRLNQIKAVVFDIGGVLIENPAQELKIFCQNQWQIKESQELILFNQFYLKHFYDFERGFIQDKVFWYRVLEDSHHLHKYNETIADQLWSQATQSCFKVKPSSLQFVNKLKSKGIQVALL